MNNEIILIQEAQDSLLDIINWYDIQQEGLSEKFLAELEKIMDSILLFPKQHPMPKRPYRLAVFQKFPFVMVYEAQKKCVFVYQIFHTHQNHKQQFC